MSLIGAIRDAVVSDFEKELGKRDKKIADLEKRLDALETVKPADTTSATKSR